MLRFTALLAGALLSANAFALSLANLSQTDASGGLKDALSQGAQIAPAEPPPLVLEHLSRRLQVEQRAADRFQCSLVGSHRRPLRLPLT